MFDQVSVDLTDLAELNGAGTLDLTLNQMFYTSGSTLTPSANLAFGGTASSNFDLTLTYDVPEPAGLAILGVGLLGLAIMQRRFAG